MAKGEESTVQHAVRAFAQKVVGSKSQGYTVSPLDPQVPQPRIQPTSERKYSERKFRKVSTRVLETTSVAFTLY